MIKTFNLQVVNKGPKDVNFAMYPTTPTPVPPTDGDQENADPNASALVPIAWQVKTAFKKSGKVSFQVTPASAQWGMFWRTKKSDVGTTKVSEYSYTPANPVAGTTFSLTIDNNGYKKFTRQNDGNSGSVYVITDSSMPANKYEVCLNHFCCIWDLIIVLF